MAYSESNGSVADEVMWPWKIKVVAKKYLDANILKNVMDSIGQSICSLNIKNSL